jgi:hypothetical protein
MHEAQLRRKTLVILSLILASAAQVRGGFADEPKRSGMVVVAPEAFHSALEDYLKLRRGQRAVELASLERILRETDGADDPERLKHWLYEAWRNREVRYVLLVGDADVLPVRYMVLDRVTPEAYDYAFYPCDLYYADVAKQDGSFDDWNARKNDFHATYFGEVRGEKNKQDPINFDDVDYRPELALGRWPVSTAEDAKRVAEKTITYEQGLRAETSSGLRRALFVSVPGWVDTRARMNGWANQLPVGWSASKLWPMGRGRSTDESQVVAALDEGASLVCHAGHGQDDRWEGSLSVAALDKLKNRDRLPVVLSAGCSTARFATLPPYEPYEDIYGIIHEGTNNGEKFHGPPPPPSVYARGRFNLTGLGERLVRDSDNGAVAYIGCNTGSQPCGLSLLDGFVQALANLPEPTLGDCWAEAVAHYYRAEKLDSIVPNDDWYPASIFFQGMKFMVFGDPALPLPGPKR